MRYTKTLYGVVLYENSIAFVERKTIWKEVVVACFKVPFWKLLGGNEEDDRSCQ